MKLTFGKRYSRSEISEMMGGSIQAYLPFKDGRVTCGCFRVEETLNPGAPEEVLFGRVPIMPDVEKSAEMVSEQGKSGEAVPVFIFKAKGKWEYVGDYRCTELIRDASELRRKENEHPCRGSITGILRFEIVIKELQIMKTIRYATEGTGKYTAVMIEVNSTFGLLKKEEQIGIWKEAEVFLHSKGVLGGLILYYVENQDCVLVGLEQTYQRYRASQKPSYPAPYFKSLPNHFIEWEENLLSPYLKDFSMPTPP
jgi:hypothetical protein